MRRSSSLSLKRGAGKRDFIRGRKDGCGNNLNDSRESRAASRKTATLGRVTGTCIQQRQRSDRAPQGASGWALFCCAL